MRPPCLASSTLAALAAAFVLGLGLANPRDARACGGCFHGPPQQNEVESVVTDHRMVFAVSTQQTVLWDQIRYSGDPQLFAWVLPIKPGARLELSHDEWIAALDASTQPVVLSPIVNCPVSGTSSRGSGCGFMGSTMNEAAFGASADAGFHDGDGVMVVRQDVIGPYETVTLRSSMGDALDAWLVGNGFVVPDSLRPMLSAYANEGFDFLALKLAPGQGVRAMQPVRVVTDGADATMPLRMVAAGIGSSVGITLWVVGEGRYHPQSFPDAPVDFGQLTWDNVQSRSNYAELVGAAMAAGDGRGWVTEFAGPMPAGNGQNPGLAQAYESTCPSSGVILPLCDDAGAVDGGACGVPQPCDDLMVATAGMHAGNVWVTRMRASLPASAIPAGDLVLEADPTQRQVPNVHQATRFSDPKFNPCPASNPASGGSDDTCACRLGERRVGGGEAIAFGIGAIVFTVSLRKRRRDRASGRS